MSKFISLIFIVTIFLTKFCFADVISYNSPEVKQLEAMGYEIDKTEKQSDLIIASNGSNRILLSRNSERLAIFRNFNRKKLSNSDEFELLKIVNKINNDLSLQVSVNDNSMTFVLYMFSNHDPKIFSRLVRFIEKSDTVFDSYPNLLKLMNN